MTKYSGKLRHPAVSTHTTALVERPGRDSLSALCCVLTKRSPSWPVHAIGRRAERQLPVVRVIVIGGGAIGLCVAEALAVRGCEVTVFERDRCGAAASAGNAGWISPSLSLPVPGPGVISDLVRSLVNPSAPLWIRPTLSPATLGSIARFLAYCRRSAHRRALAAMQRAATLAGPAFDRLAERGVQLELHDDPLLCPRSTARSSNISDGW